MFPLDSAAQARCRKECGETVGKLQKKNEELQRHLEKACRQLQHSVREHKTAMQLLKGARQNRHASHASVHLALTQLSQLFTRPRLHSEEHESSLEKAKEEQRQQLEGVNRAEASSGFVSHVASIVNCENSKR